MDPNVKDITPAVIPALAFLVIGSWVVKEAWRDVRENSEIINKALEIKRELANRNVQKEKLG